MTLYVVGLDPGVGNSTKFNTYGKFDTKAITSPSFATTLEDALEKALEHMSVLRD
jgi:hypothetical protein